jgi:hypothetical protein
VKRQAARRAAAAPHGYPGNVTNWNPSIALAARRRTMEAAACRRLAYHIFFTMPLPL